MGIDYGALARQHGGSVVDEESDGMLSPGNINLSNRPRVRNKDGSISTVRSISVNLDGKEYLIPTVTDDGRVVSDDEAVKLFKRTRKHLGVFDTSEHATAYAQGLHSDQSKMIGQGVDYAALAKQHGGAVVEETPTVPETPFPTPGQTAGTMAIGALKAIPGMARGAVEGATAPFTAIPREAMAAVRGQPSPTMQQIRESAGHLGAAFAPGSAGPGERLGEAVSAIPTVGPAVMGAVRGAGTIATPAYKAATGGVGTITPEEMNQAAETGGAAVAGLSVPEIGKYGGPLAGKVPGGVGKVLQFSQKHAPTVATAAFQGALGHSLAAAKTLLGAAIKPAVLEAMGTIKQDAILTSVAAGDVEGAAAALAKGIEKSPAAAKAMAEALKAEAEKVGVASAGPTTVPEMAPPRVIKPIPPMRNATPDAIKARAAERTARQQGALAKSQAQVGASTVVATPVVEQALTTIEKRGAMPVKGNVTMPSISTKPKGTGPTGRPLTPKQREMRMNQLKAAQAAGLDIWEAFGVPKEP